MLPMFPRRPIVLGGLIAPALWSGLLYATLGLLNPLLASRIDWLWFMASQVAFGIVAGLAGRSPGAHSYPERMSLLCYGCWNRSSRNDSTKTERGEPLMKKKCIRTRSALAILSLVMLSACSTFNRVPQTDPEPIAPSQVLEFDTLYTQNCAGCHGARGRGGASIALANPVYLAIVDETTMRNTIAKGVRRTSMPAFAQSARAEC